MIQLLDLAGRHLTELLLSSVEFLLSDRKLPAELSNWRFVFGLLQGQCDRLFRKSLFRIAMFPLSKRGN
jgi:hypothetical protein